MPLNNGCRSTSRDDVDVVFRALSDAYRRRILIALMRDNPRDQEEFETVEFGSTADEEALTLELHHAHLPHLDEAGFIDWDRDDGRIVRGDDFERIRPLLELMDDHREELPLGWP